MFDDLTLVTCSYNTPEILETMLKSFIRIHGNGPHNILIYDNSTNEETAEMLDKYGIKYIRNPGYTHSKGVEQALLDCRTKYALLVDSDIIFKANIEGLYKTIKDNDITLGGELCASRGGYNLHPRIHPWFCFINVENVRKHGIKFTDMDRIEKSKASGFYKNIPLNETEQGNEIPMYDVGATFYEDIKNADLKIGNISNISQWFKHYEGSSWQRVSGHEGFEKLGNKVWVEYQEEIKKHKGIILNNQFKSIEKGSKYAFIYPVFAPDRKRLEQCKKSLKSFLDNDCLKNVDIIAGGWCSKKKYWEEIDELVEAKRFNKNYGKAHIINDLSLSYLELNPDCEYFLSCDSDIILPEDSKDIFNRMATAAVELESKGHKFAYFSLEQLEMCCHQHQNFDKSLKLGNEEIVWNSRLEGIAGGALFIGVEFWKEVNGYRVMGVYSGDDGYLLYDSKVLGRLASVIKTVPVIHPGGAEPEYTEWKYSQLAKCTGHEKDINESIKEANKWWNIEDEHFKIVIPCGPVEKWIDKCINSLKIQKHKNWEAIVVLDPCGDNSYEAAKEAIGDDSRFTIKKNDTQMFALYNIVNGIKALIPNDEDIVVILDGDDWLTDENSLSIVADKYRDSNVLVTHGNYMHSSDGTLSPTVIPYELNEQPRYVMWKGTHLKTMKYKVLRRIKPEDLKEDDKYFEVTYDLALMFPAFEMVGNERIGYIKEPIYVYNNENPISDCKIKQSEQARVDGLIRRKPQYSRVEF